MRRAGADEMGRKFGRDGDNRDLVRLRRRDPGDQVGGARPRHGQADARMPGNAGIAERGKGGAAESIIPKIRRPASKKVCGPATRLRR